MLVSTPQLLATVRRAPARVAPAWMGEVQVTLSRDTAGGSKPIGKGFLFDTWARQRAALTQLTFQVWAPGLTDRENPDLWRQLDVKLHYRFGGKGRFLTQPVNIAGRSGNNAVYGVDLRALDPWRPGGTPVPTRVSPDGLLRRAKLDFYFTVNGAALRPAPGKSFVGYFENYK